MVKAQQPDQYLALIFCTDKSDWVSTAIRWLTWWKHSHVGMVSPYAPLVIESTHGVGVREVSMASFLNRDGAEVRYLPCADPARAWDRALSQVGKPYDWRFAWGWLFRRNWQDNRAWACSELIAWAAECVPDEMTLDTISPRDLFLLTEDDA